MAISAEEITEAVKGEAEGIHLPVGEALNSRSIEAHTKNIA
jgi:hypothetical protein